MIFLSISSLGRNKPCGICKRSILKGEPFVQFYGSMRGRRENLCVKCMHDIALKHYKETWVPPFECKDLLEKENAEVGDVRK